MQTPALEDGDGDYVMPENITKYARTFVHICVRTSPKMSRTMQALLSDSPVKMSTLYAHANAEVRVDT
jgi:hypothetical protein